MLLDVIMEFMSDAVSEAVSWLLSFFGEAVQLMTSTVFYFEQSPVVIGASSLVEDILQADNGMAQTFIDLTNSAGRILRIFALTILTLKFLKKGFDMYAADIDGEADEDAGTLVTRYIYAIVACAAFPMIYNVIVSILNNLYTQLLNIVADTFSINMADFGTVIMKSISLVNVLLALVYVVLIGILMFQFMQRGLEMWIMRIGAPIFSIGLLDADKGLFNNWVRKIIQNSITVIVQGFLLELSLVFAFGATTLMISIVCMIVAIKTPKLLQEYMMPMGGGNVMMNVSYAANLGKSVAGLFKGR